MATDTYLEMVSDMIVETGLNSSVVPSTLEGVTGDVAKVAYWIRIADQRIQRERIDWQFLHVLSAPVELTQSSNLIPMPSANDVVNGTDPNDITFTVNKVIRDSFAIINSSGEVHRPCFMEWRDFSTQYMYGTPQPESDYPGYWTVNPAKRAIWLSNPVASAGLTYVMQYYRTPSRLRLDTDTSLIPDDFNRLIVVLGKILYAEHEDAPEVSAGSHEEYEHMFNQMLSVWGPDNEWQHMDQDIPMTVTTDGEF